MLALIVLLLPPGIVQLNICSYLVIRIFTNLCVFNQGKDTVVLQFFSIALLNEYLILINTWIQIENVLYHELRQKTAIKSKCCIFHSSISHNHSSTQVHIFFNPNVPPLENIFSTESLAYYLQSLESVGLWTASTHSRVDHHQNLSETITPLVSPSREHASCPPRVLFSA